jgi:hypothetical protein
MPTANEITWQERFTAEYQVIHGCGVITGGGYRDIIIEAVNGGTTGSYWFAHEPIEAGYTYQLTEKYIQFDIDNTIWFETVKYITDTHIFTDKQIISKNKFNEKYEVMGKRITEELSACTSGEVEPF